MYDYAVRNHWHIMRQLRAVINLAECRGVDASELRAELARLEASSIELV